MSAQPTTTTTPTTRTRRRTRIVPALGYPGFFRQVQYWDPITCVWADFGDVVQGMDAARVKAARCERGENP